MARTDQYGYSIGLETVAGVDHWNGMIHGFLSHSTTAPDHLKALLEAEPDFALGHACKGLFCMLLGRREMTAVARQAYATADRIRQQGALSRHEIRYIDALGVWLEGRPNEAAHLIDLCLKNRPGDALSLKLVHAILFMMGHPRGMRGSIERVIEVYDDQHPAAGYARGCYAFTLEETGDYGSAERWGKMGVDLCPDDAWGLHAVAHVYDMTGRAADGVDWLTPRASHWQHCNNFGFHVWWHLALFHLDQGDTDRVLDLYDRHIRAVRSDDFRDISNGASMLARLELEKVDVGDRWEELAELSDARSDDGSVVFADLHYMLSLIGGKRDGAVTTLLTHMRRCCDGPEGDMDRVRIETGVPMAEGLVAFGEGRYADALPLLVRGEGTLQAIGGSHAQRDVFNRLTIESALRAGRLTDAKTLIERRASRRGAHDAYSKARLALLDGVPNERPTDGAVSIPA